MVMAEKGKTVEIDEMLASRDKTIDEAKEEAKRTRRELELLRRVVRSDDRMSQLLTRLGSKSEIIRGSESESGRSGGGYDFGRFFLKTFLEKIQKMATLQIAVQQDFTRAGDMSSGKVFPGSTKVNLVNTFPGDMSPRNGTCGMDDGYVSSLDCLRDTIPSFDFSYFTNKDTASSKTQQTLASALFSDLVKDIEFHFDMTVRQKAVFKCLPPVNFLTDPLDGRSTLRPTGVLIFRWVGGKHACVDLTRVSPLVGLSSRGFTVGQAALKDSPCKVTKHEKTCIKNQHVFVPFAFDTFGFLAPEAVELLNIVQ
nr:auxilin-like protein [Tanacetum cinerariifolium]